MSSVPTDIAAPEPHLSPCEPPLLAPGAAEQIAPDAPDALAAADPAPVLALGDAPVIRPFAGRSVCLFCGSSEASDPAYTQAARAFGAAVAGEGWRLVYGGGGVGLMGASARAAHAAGGRVLGVMPAFLRGRERLFDDVETLVVTSMHQRKTIMYDQSDAFVVAPGGVGTLEEAIELLSWKRLDLHAKPVIFLNLDGFWDTLFAMLEHSVAQRMTPPAFLEAYGVARTVDEAMEMLRRPAEAAQAIDRR